MRIAELLRCKHAVVAYRRQQMFSQAATSSLGGTYGPFQDQTFSIL